MRSTFFFLSLLITLGACGQTDQSFDEKLESLYSHTVPLIKPQELKLELDRDSNIYLLDTRAREEYDVSHIPNARFVDYDGFKPEDVVNIPKDAKVITYCSVGYRSEKIGEQLQELGFKDVHNLYGGIFEWVHQDYPIVNQAGEATNKVHTYNKSWSKWLQKGEKVW